jgi:hypothetical protein
VCGARETRTFRTEYGWHGDSSWDGSTASMEHTRDEQRYLRIGEATVELCMPCVRERHERRSASDRKIAGGVFVGAVGLFAVTSWRLWEEPDPQGLLDVGVMMLWMLAAGVLALAAVLLLLAAFHRVRGWVTGRVEAPPDPDELAVEAVGDWPWELCRDEIEAELADVDPHYLFFPNAPQVEYGFDAASQVRFTKRARSHPLGEGWQTDRYSIGPKPEDVEGWTQETVPEKKPPMGITAEAELRRATGQFLPRKK